MEMFLILLTTATALVICVIYYYYKKHLNDPEKIRFFKNLPGPTPVFLLGNILDFKTKGVTKETFGTFQRYVEKYGKIFKFEVMLVKTICTADAKFIAFVLNSDAMLRKAQNYDIMKDWLGSAVLLSSGETWEKQRRMITNFLQLDYLKEYVNAFERQSGILVNKLLHLCADNQSIDLHHLVKYCCLDIAAECALGFDTNAQGENKSDYIKSVEELCGIIAERFSNPLKMMRFTFRFTKDYHTQKKCLQILHDFSSDIIKKRKEELEENNLNGSDNNKEQGQNKKKIENNLLDLLLKYKDNGRSLDFEEIRQEVDMAIFGGHDTLTVGITFTLFCLANHPDVQKKAILEQKQLFGDNSDPILQYSDLQKMEYLDMVIKETLRLYPPVPVIGRYTEQEATYGDMVIPKGINLAILIYQMHRLEEYFPDPLKFDPERFANSAEILPYSYMTFPGGVRNCLGAKFAMLEIKSVVSKILRNFELLPAVPQHDLQLRLESVLKSANGVKIRLKSRST